jgi:SurA-like protein
VRAREGERSGLIWLVLFGGLFALLFLGLAVTVDFGSPRIPPGAIAYVEEAPPGTGEISMAEFDQAMLQSAAIGGQKRPPEPGDEGYEQARSEALSGLITAVWLRGQAEEMGIVASDGEVSEKLAKSGEARSLRAERFTRKTMYERVRGEMLVRRIEEALEQEAEKPTAAEVRAYYEEEPLGEEESAEQKPFAEAKAEVRTALQGIRNQEVFSEFDAAFPEAWQPRTHCADGFVVEQCANFPAFAHAAPPACYEANPKEPAEACPAPVPQRSAAQPGTVTPFKAGGEAFVQRPFPEVVEGEGSPE